MMTILQVIVIRTCISKVYLFIYLYGIVKGSEIIMTIKTQKVQTGVYKPAISDLRHYLGVT